MGKKQLQKDIRMGEGMVFSNSTLNLNHLLAKAYDIMVIYNLRTPLKKEILEAFDYQNEKPLNNSLVDAVFYGRELKDEFTAAFLWDEVCDYFEDIAPKGYGFGSCVGDGACIGWHEVDLV